MDHWLKNCVSMKLPKSLSKEQLDNKALVEKYPFLMPRNVFSDEIPEDYNYSYTKLDQIPYGWRHAFGLAMMEEIRLALGKHIHAYRVNQIKEKYGTLRWYDNGGNDKVHEVVRKYGTMSGLTCIDCGKHATRISFGYILPFCDNCGDNEHHKRDYVPLYKWYKKSKVIKFKKKYML